MLSLKIFQILKILVRNYQCAEFMSVAHFSSKLMGEVRPPNCEVCVIDGCYDSL